MRLPLALLAALAIAFAGCAERTDAPGGADDGAPSTDTASRTPEQRALLAAERLGGDLEKDGGDIRKMSMRANDTEMGTMLVDVELGTDETLKMAITAGAFSMTVYCAADGGTFLQMGADVYETRATDGCDDAEDDDSEEEDEDSMDGGMADDVESPLDIADLEGANVTQVTENADGSIDARVVDEDGEEARLHIDAEGRVVRMTATEDGTAMAVTFEYGARSAIVVPEATGRIPVSLYASETFEEGAFLWEALSVDTEAPLAEFEVRVHAPPEPEEDEEGSDEDVDEGDGTSEEDFGEDDFDMGDFDTGPPTGAVLAAFDLGAAGEQDAGGWTFAFTDDGDGMLSEGDKFVLTPPGGTAEGDFVVAVYDAWAERYANDSPVPGVGAALAALAVVGAAAMAGRRPRP